MADEPQGLPDFENPPVVETALGVEFSPIKGWTGLHAGLYWAEIREDYPSFEVQPPLGSQIERFGQAETLPAPPVVIDIATGAQRYWFVDRPKLRLLQLQDTRLLVNWKKSQEADEYPRYPSCREHFTREWTRFRTHLRKTGMAEPHAIQCEVTYVNHFLQGREWSTPSDLPKILSVWSGPPAAGYLPLVDRAAVNLRFTMPNQMGRLHVAVGHGFRLADRKDIIQMTLTARGAPASSSDEDIRRWIDSGREWIVRGFAQLTTPAMHALWKRKA